MPARTKKAKLKSTQFEKLNITELQILNKYTMLSRKSKKKSEQIFKKVNITITNYLSSFFAKRKNN